MKISFWIPAVVFYVVRVVFSNSVHVGTVLFTTTDLVRKCWTDSDKALLKARLVMQDVLPDPDCIDFSNPHAIAILLEYFHSCFQIISTATYGRIQNLMYLALADALGGYLRAYVLPFTRMAYYAGQVKYAEAKKLFQLYDDIRVFLKTNGVGWVEPQKVCVPNFHVKPLVITGGALEACKELYIIEKEGRLHSLNVHSKKKKKSRKKFDETTEKVWGGNSKRFDQFEKFRRKREKCEDFNFCNSTANYNGTDPVLKNLVKEMENSTECRICEGTKDEEQTNQNVNESTKRVIVPLPILDDCSYPHSLAIPFKKKPFRTLTSADSAFILEYYYLTVLQCFIGKGNTRSDIKNFNGHFHSWLASQVRPHLCEEQWYPAFGGVLRIFQTIKKFGVENSAKDTDMNDIAFLFSEGVEFDDMEEFRPKEEHKGENVGMSDFGLDGPNNKRHVVIAVVVASIFWLLLFCAIVFFFQARSQKSTCTRRNGSSFRSASQTECSSAKQTECKNLNFEFLIKFFKQKKECQQQPKPPPQDFFQLGKQKEETKDFPQENGCKRKTNPCGKKRKTCVFPMESFTPLFDKVMNEKPGIFGGEEPRHKNRGQGDQLQMLWKKPSDSQNVAFGDESRYYYSTEKQTTTSCSRESLQTQTTTTSSTQSEGSTEESECRSSSSTPNGY